MTAGKIERGSGVLGDGGGEEGRTVLANMCATVTACAGCTISSLQMLRDMRYIHSSTVLPRLLEHDVTCIMKHYNIPAGGMFVGGLIQNTGFSNQAVTTYGVRAHMQPVDSLSPQVSPLTI